MTYYKAFRKRLGSVTSRLVVVVLVTLLLFGCAGPLTMDQLQTLQRGQSPAQVQEQLKRPPEAQFSLQHANKEYHVEIYQMQTGSRMESSVVCNQYGCYPMSYSVPVTQLYLFVYEADSGLYTWGFEEEVSKSEEGELVGLTQRIQEAYREYQAKNNPEDW